MTKKYTKNEIIFAIKSYYANNWNCCKNRGKEPCHFDKFGEEEMNKIIDWLNEYL